MDRQVDKAKLQAATANACAALTEGMTDEELQQRLDDVRGKLKASVDRDGRPLRGFADRVAAIKVEIARLEGLLNGNTEAA
jgi:hypothetical protein